MLMKATGIVRRIDDLGRVVIPKEIRRTLRIREGDPLEIFVDRDGEVILKKYSPIGELGDFAKEYAESLYEGTGHITIISDRDTYIAVAGGSKKEYLEKPIGTPIENCMDNRKTLLETAWRQLRNHQGSPGNAVFFRGGADHFGRRPDRNGHSTQQGRLRENVTAGNQNGRNRGCVSRQTNGAVKQANSRFRAALAALPGKAGVFMFPFSQV